jgi:hypothetical protein
MVLKIQCVSSCIQCGTEYCRLPNNQHYDDVMNQAFSICDHDTIALMKCENCNEYGIMFDLYT